MRWTEKQAKSPDANLKQEGGQWSVRVKLTFANGTIFERRGKAATKTAARRMRDGFYELFNESALALLSGATEVVVPSMTVGELALRCRDSWWPARGRSMDTAEAITPVMRSPRSMLWATAVPPFTTRWGAESRANLRLATVAPPSSTRQGRPRRTSIPRPTALRTPTTRPGMSSKPKTPTDFEPPTSIKPIPTPF